jgi:5-methylcytosine-specific restriction protein A
MISRCHNPALRLSSAQDRTCPTRGGRSPAPVPRQARTPDLHLGAGAQAFHPSASHSSPARPSGAVRHPQYSEALGPSRRRPTVPGHRWNHTQTRHERGYGAAWVKRRAAVLARDLHLCQPCLTHGRYKTATQVDHITPKASGGTDDLDNLQSICTACHNDKTKAEAAEAQGRKLRCVVGPDGWPVA